MNAKGFDPAKFANKTIFVAPDDDDSESRRKMITIGCFLTFNSPD